MDMKVAIFGTIPEAILMGWTGLLLMGVKPKFRNVIILGVLQGSTVIFLKNYTNFGLHTFVIVVTFMVYTCLIMKVKLSVGIMSILLSWSIVTLVEGSLFIFMNVNIVYLLSTDWMRILYLLPHEIVLGFIVYIGQKKDISILNEFGYLKKIFG